jgi:hypothetical protein
MDQTDFAFLVGICAGAPAGGIGLSEATNWTPWIAFPVGAVEGFFVAAVVTFLLVEWLGRRQERRKRMKS